MDLQDILILAMATTSPAYILPLILGPIILVKFKDDTGRLAGWFTLKPLVATPLIVVMSYLVADSTLSEDLKLALSLVPAVILTLLIIWRFRGSFQAGSWIPIVLVAGDALRWMNTFVILRVGIALDDPFFVAGLILPNAYALMALVLVILHLGTNQPVAGEALPQ